MKAISVRQPWARCIASGAKPVENRGRSTSHRGPIAIHASTRPDLEADRDPRVVRLFGADPRLSQPVGAVIAVANLVDCHGRTQRGCCAPWGEDWHASAAGVGWAHHLVLEDVVALPVPVYCRGMVMVPWTLPVDAAARVSAQLIEIGDPRA